MHTSEKVARIGEERRKKLMFEKNCVVTSLRGHDTKRKYIVYEIINKDFCLVVDGVYRKKDNPKKKRIKHLKNEFKKCDKDIKQMHDFEIATYLKNL